MVTKLPGLKKEKLPSGNYRYRVVVATEVNRKIALPVGPDHPDFLEIYQRAREGIVMHPRAGALQPKGGHHGA